MALDNLWLPRCIIPTEIMKISPRLVDVVRSTIVQVEQTADLPPDDPAIVELKSSIVRSVTELEIAKFQKSTPTDQ
jgi:hypothetical protein